jgi:FdhD protein
VTYADASLKSGDVDPELIHDVEVWRYDQNVMVAARDELAAEEPFEIRLGGQSLAVIMRTPGHDAELATGFLLSEGLISNPEDLDSIQVVLDRDGFPERNALEVRLRHDLIDTAIDRRRPFTVTSSCGLCGSVSIEQACARIDPIDDHTRTSPSILLGLSRSMRSAQPVFARTGGLHAAGLFTSTGDRIVLREDVGRHNAVDKVVGERFLKGLLPLRSTVMLVSGRASFELTQKAAVAGVPILAAVGAPSSLAVEAARSFGLTLVGLLRDERFVVYSRPERISRV